MSVRVIGRMCVWGGGGAGGDMLQAGDMYWYCAAQ